MRLHFYVLAVETKFNNSYKSSSFGLNFAKLSSAFGSPPNLHFSGLAGKWRPKVRVPAGGRSDKAKRGRSGTDFGRVGPL